MRVAIIGIGMTKCGIFPDRSLRSLIAEAASKAIEDAGIERKEIDGVMVGNAVAPVLTGENNVSAIAVDYAGLLPKPAMTVEGACATGALALRVGITSILSGFHDIVMVIGAEKMSDVPTEIGTSAIASDADTKNEFYFGLTFPSMVALLSRMYMKAFNVTVEDIAAIASKNHNNSVDNPYAHLRFPATIEDVLKSPMVADPLTYLMCCPMTDAAAAVILCREDLAKKYTDNPVWITGSGHSNDYFSITDKKYPFGPIELVRRACDEAYKMAGVSPEDIDVAEVYDSFAPLEAIGVEGAGLVEEGKGGKAAIEGLTQRDGQIPVNTTGGVLCRGHPIGATGVLQVIDIVRQLRGEAGKCQVDNPEVGLTLNFGGPGSVCVVHVLRRD